MKKIFLSLFLFLFILIEPSFSEKIVAFQFNEEELKSLKVKKVKGEIKWKIGKNDNGNFIRSEANGKGSGLGKEIKIDLLKTPFINITWKVEKNLSGIVENSKKGHDFAARVFVVKETGSTALSNRAISYVFSSNNLVNDYWPSPYTKKSIDYVLSTTKENDNEWVTVKANVRDHFKLLHNLEVEDLDGVAIMTDTDNSKLEAIAYYKNIYSSGD